MADKQNIYVRNSGMVLLSPFIPKLFERLGVIINGQFSNHQNQEKAARFLQYVTTGTQSTTDSELVLNKILCGLSLKTTLFNTIEITGEEVALTDQLLKALISQWSALGRTSVEGLREAFLIREGILSEFSEQWKLTVNRGTFDILLSRCPFSFSVIKYPWMEKPLVVDWGS